MQQTQQPAKGFYGWWITLAAFFTFGLAVGIPYYGGPFFYDYYEKDFGWKRPETTFGFPIAALLTLWVGPMLVHRFSPRKLILIGTACTALAFVGFSRMNGSLWGMYYPLWVLYTVGYIFSGPIAHQVIISQWFRKNRGFAMAVVYCGVGLFAAVAPRFIVKPITEATDYKTALIAVAGMLLLAWPIAIFILRDRPADMNQFPDGASHADPEVKAEPKTFSFLLSQPAFWLLLVGSACSIGAIGSINQHLKFVFRDQGFTNQTELNTAWANANFWIMISSTVGRLVMGYLADRFNKKWVMLATYALVAATIPILLTVRPTTPEMLYAFAILFGFGLGADYMLIPLMAAEQFGVNSLARTMAVILPTDTIGQTWFPFLIAVLFDQFGSYNVPMQVVLALAAVGAVAIALLPNKKKTGTPLAIGEPQQASAKI